MGKRLTIVICSLVAGIGIGILLLFALPRVLRFDHPLLRIIGVRKPEIIGFLPYWLLDKADGDYGRSLTTLSYFGLALDGDGKPVYLVKPGEEDPGWTALKGDKWAAQSATAAKSGLKQSLLVHLADDEIIATLIADPETHGHALVAEVGPVMKKRGFTDLNLDIESFTVASPSARESYTRFVRTVAGDLRKGDMGSLTVEIPPIALFKANLADPQALGAIADAVVLMTYDYNYAGSFLAGPVAPVGGAGSVREFDVTLAVTEALRVIPKEKIILGIPLYGYEWETIRGEAGAATIPGGASVASGKRIASLLSSCASCSATMDPVANEPHIIYANEGHYQQIFYENAASLAQKIALAERLDLRGIALWALGYEDPSLLDPLERYTHGFRFTFLPK